VVLAAAAAGLAGLLQQWRQRWRMLGSSSSSWWVCSVMIRWLLLVLWLLRMLCLPSTGAGEAFFKYVRTAWL
jgi:hypothetical protein